MAKKGLNMEKVIEIRNEVEEVMEMKEHVGVSQEELEALREMRIEKQIEVMNDLYVKELNEMMIEIKNKVDNGIKYAILKGKDATDVAKFAPAKQIMGIFKSYKDITGVEMSDTQKDYIKTLNSQQLSNILYTLNVARKTLVA